MSEAAERGGRRGARRPKRKNNHDFFVVGLGASAGGIKALEGFFEHLPTPSGMAFVVILHLSPHHESHLAELIQRKTSMPVIQVQETVRVEPDHVYVIPPAKHLAMSDSHIKVMAPKSEKGKRSPIDLFFRSMSQAFLHHGIGIVLSGTGTDGTLGLRRLKENSGISIAQDPQEAEYEGMPRSAIASGMVDFVLPVGQIPEKLLVVRNASREIQLPPEGDKLPKGTEADALRGVLTYLRLRTGHDFSNYKQSTVVRRITRRMQVNTVVTLAAYAQYLRDHPTEVRHLLSDLLITVTNFFRDQEAFDVLAREVVPKLFSGKEAGEQVRIWVMGCATGEEAYSLAMLLQEYTGHHDLETHVQIFATDIDEESITQAREGLFPETISTDVSPERLRRFFTEEGTHYRIKKEIREMVLFAPHNILRDPPFSKLDLISCRNVLIYLNREMQERVLEIFHFSLRPNGFLFLGSSESADGASELFRPVDKKQRIFQRRAVAQSPFVAAMPIGGKWDFKPPTMPTPPDRPTFSYGELHQLLLEEFSPPSILVNQGYDIVHLSESAARYLRFAGGEPSRNLLKAVHPDLRLDLRAALFTASQEGRPAETRPLSVSLAGEPQRVNLIVRPVMQPDALRGFLVIIFDEDGRPRKTVAAPPEAEGDSQVSETDSMIRRLEDELQRAKDQLRTTIEQYETSTEELKASNEELQAINEELRSTTEELETSKEELQSVNEELTTVNHELKEKVDEVIRANSDLQNLMAATDIGTIFLDRAMRIKRFTPIVTQLFNIIELDVGRPLSHLTHQLDYDHLSADAAQVLQTLIPFEREVHRTDGRWYILRILPYRTLQDKIDGVVVTFVDITERKCAQSQVEASEEHLRLLVESVADYAIFTLDREGRILTWNPGAKKIFGFKEPEALGQSWNLLFTPEDRANGLPQREFQQALAAGRAEDERWHMRKDGSRFYASGVIAPLRVGQEVVGYVKVLRDLTERREREEALHRAHGELEVRINDRTQELEASNQQLQAETIERRNADAQIKELLHRIEMERHRISRDLHDLLGQQLTALRLNLEMFKERSGDPAALKQQIERAQTIAQQLDSEVDFMIWELRPSVLGELGLVAALENFIQEWSRHFGIAAEFHTTGLAGSRLPVDVKTNLYRITQEALTNVFKHTKAKQVAVILERREHEVALIIEDDGQGFEPQEELSQRRGLGLVSMRERAEAIGGKWEIESATGQGTTIFVRVPHDEDDEAERKESDE